MVARPTRREMRLTTGRGTIRVPMTLNHVTMMTIRPKAKQIQSNHAPGVCTRAAYATTIVKDFGRDRAHILHDGGWSGGRAVPSSSAPCCAPTSLRYGRT